jgi:hypothetical protein
MAHTDFVCIGKTQRNGKIAVAQVFFDLVYLAADISARPADVWQKFLLNPVSQYYWFTSIHERIIAYNCYEYEG